MLFNWSRQLTNNSLSHPTYQLIYLHTYPPTILQTYLITLLLLPTYHPTFLFINLFTYILTNLLLFTYHPKSLPTYVLWIISYLLTYPFIYQTSCILLPNYLTSLFIYITNDVK
jgi:hypothetical protein